MTLRRPLRDQKQLPIIILSTSHSSIDQHCIEWKETDKSIESHQDCREHGGLRWVRDWENQSHGKAIHQRLRIHRLTQAYARALVLRMRTLGLDYEASARASRRERAKP